MTTATSTRTRTRTRTSTSTSTATGRDSTGATTLPRRAARLLAGLAAIAALATASAGTASAQCPAPAGYGYGIGMTIYDQEMLKQGINGLYQSQYELNECLAYRARVEAELMQAQLLLAREQAMLTRYHSVEAATTLAERDAKARPAARGVAAAEEGPGRAKAHRGGRPGSRPQPARGRGAAGRLAGAPAGRPVR